MDSNNQGMNAAYMSYNNGTNFDQNQFYNDMQNFTTGNNDAQPSYDPALFDMPDLASYPQQNQTQQQQQQQQQQQSQSQPNYGQPIQPRQSQSPALPQYKPAQQSQYGHQQYSGNMFDQRTTPQPSYDPHLMPRPSPSPGAYERYPYQQHLGYPSQQFDPRFVHYQSPQQSSTPGQSFPQQTSQSSHQYMNIAARPPSQPSQYQMQGMFQAYQPQQQNSHHFVDPSLLNTNGGLQSPNRQIQPSPYFPGSGPTIDPRTLQPQLQQQSQSQVQMQMHNQTQVPRSLFQSEPNIPQGPVHGQYMQMQFPPQAAETVKPDPGIATTKKLKSKAKKDGAVPGTAHSAASSDDDLEIAPNPSEQKPPVLLAPRPADQKGKLVYDIVEAIWSDRNNIAPPEKIRSSIASFGDLVRGLRDGWKSQNEQLKKAEIPNSPSATQASALKADVERHREMMLAAIINAFDFGHPAILRRLGDNQFTMSAMYSFLLDRVNADDYNSELVKVILKLATKFETLDDEQLEKVKWTKILTRFTKKSSNESKDFALKILSNAKAAGAKKKTRDGPQSPSADGKLALVAGVKRSRDGDAASLPVTKKAIVKPASKPLSVQIAERRKLQEKENSAKSAKAEKAAVNGAQATSTDKPKPVAAPVKIGPFASLTSASKKPGTSNAERAAASVKDKPEALKAVPLTATSTTAKHEVQATASPPLAKAAPAATSSSFLGYLADMDKPKESQAPKVEEVSNETSEQKEKRLRKESRRRLRVSWKPDSELVETKVFEHDPDEETGHEDSMMKDAGDSGREGEMLKRHFDKDEMDDSDEEELEDTYTPPSEVDFDDIDAESRSTNFTKCGGPMKPESPSSDAQTKHEEGNLMTMYTMKEQPHTPKEIPAESDDADDDDFSPSVDFGEPEGKVRSREQTILARKQKFEAPQPAASATVDLSAMLRNLQQQQPSSNQTPAFDLQQSLGMFNQNQSTTPAQPSALAGLDLQKLLAVSQQFTSLQHNQQYSQYQAPQQQPAAAAPSLTPNLQAILAQMQGGQQPPNLAIGNGNNPNTFSGANDQSAKKAEAQKKRGKAPIGPDGKPLNYKTQVCSFWKEGKCLKGDDCTYRHDE